MGRKKNSGQECDWIIKTFILPENCRSGCHRCRCLVREDLFRPTHGKIHLISNEHISAAKINDKISENRLKLTLAIMQEFL